VTQAWLMALMLALLVAAAAVQIAYLRVLRSAGDDARVRTAAGIRIFNVVLVVVAGALVAWAILR
jgi:uncharacterized membrane protein